MQIMIQETGEIKVLELTRVGERKNTARRFAKLRAGVKRDKPNRNKGVKEYTMPYADYLEWADIMSAAQLNLVMRHEFERGMNEEVHGLIESEISDSWSKHWDLRDNKFLTLKKAVADESAIWKRLISGVVSPATDADGQAYPVALSHYRHDITDKGDQWSMLVSSLFTMTLPSKAKSYDFEVVIWVCFNRAVDETEVVMSTPCEDEWTFSFSLSSKQEEVVVSRLHQAARNYRENEVGAGMTIHDSTSKPLTEVELAKFFRGLLKDYDVAITDEEQTTIFYQEPNEAAEAAEVAFDGNTTLSIHDSNSSIGGAEFLNAYNDDLGEQAVSIHRYAASIAHLMPKSS